MLNAIYVTVVSDALSARDGAAAKAAMRAYMEAAHRVCLRQICARARADGWEQSAP